jgi:hypothetical protein
MRPRPRCLRPASRPVPSMGCRSSFPSSPGRTARRPIGTQLTVLTPGLPVQGRVAWVNWEGSPTRSMSTMTVRSTSRREVRTTRGHRARAPWSWTSTRRGLRSTRSRAAPQRARTAAVPDLARHGGTWPQCRSASGGRMPEHYPCKQLSVQCAVAWHSRPAHPVSRRGRR